MIKSLFKISFMELAACVVLISGVNYSLAATSSCDGSLSDCQAKVNSAIDGDIITFPAGTFTWTTSLSFNSKNISIFGAGEDKTIINANGTGFDIRTDTKAAFRISNMTINQKTGCVTAIKINNTKRTPTGGAYSTGWRVDHITITANDLNNVRSIFVYGLTYGLIDHVKWSSNYSIAQFLTHYAFTNDNSEADGQPFNQGTISWSLAHSLGDANAIYVEHSTLNASSTGGWAADVWYGGEVVFRYNTINRCQISTHGARNSARGGKRLEVYHNKLVGLGMKDKRVVWWRSGSGVVFNNSIDDIGYISVDNQRTCLEMATRCGVNGNLYDMNLDGTGWPCLDQPGRGYGAPLKQISNPIYAWNNGIQDDCRTTQITCKNTKNIEIGNDYELCLTAAPPKLSTHLKTGTGHVGGVVDYVNNSETPKPGYIPYEYPHPLTMTTPLRVNNLSVIN